MVKLGPGSLLAKIDIQSAFRLLPIHPLIITCWPYAETKTMYWHLLYHLGLGQPQKLFNILADLLSWIILKQGASSLLHYLDNFLTIGRPTSGICNQNLNIITRTCEELEVPLASEKIEGPATSIPFLGIILDSSKMEACLPPDKLTCIQ